MSSLVLAIEPDSRQAAILKRVVRERAHADIITVDTKDAAIAAINDRVPDLILVTALLSPRDEEELVAHLRGLDEDLLQTITIPLLATAGAIAGEEEGGFFRKAFRRKKNEGSAGVGCDPWAFADQVTGYLRDVAEARGARAAALAFEQSRNVAPLSGAPDVNDLASEVGALTTALRGERADHPGAAEPGAHDGYHAPTLGGFAHSNPAADVAELHEQPAQPEASADTDAGHSVSDPDYAFSWRSSKPEGKGKKGRGGSHKSSRGSSHEVPRERSRAEPATSVVLPVTPAEPTPAVAHAAGVPEPTAPPGPTVVPEPTAAPEPVVVPQAVAAREPVASAIVRPEPVIAPAVAAPEFAAAAPQHEPVVPESIASGPEPAAAYMPPTIEMPGPAAVAREPVVGAHEPVAAPPQAKGLKPPKGAKSAKPAKVPEIRLTPEPPPLSEARKAPPSPPVVLRPLQRLPPLAMWARIDEPVEETRPAPAPHSRHEDDDVAALIGGLRVPPHVLAVSYPRRPYIHRVRSAA